MHLCNYTELSVILSRPAPSGATIFLIVVTSVTLYLPCFLLANAISSVSRVEIGRPADPPHMLHVTYRILWLKSTGC